MPLLTRTSTEYRTHNSPILQVNGLNAGPLYHDPSPSPEIQGLQRRDLPEGRGEGSSAIGADFIFTVGVGKGRWKL